MNIQLNDTQLVIINRAVARGNVVPAFDKNATTASYRSYVTSVNGLIKKGIVDVKSGLKGAAQQGDYVESDNRRLFLTPAFIKAYFDDVAPVEEKAPEAPKATKTKKAAKVAAPAPVVVETPSDELDEAIDDLDMEIDSPKSVVAESYKKQYSELKAVGGSGQGCNDPIDRFFRAHFMGKVEGKGRARLDVVALVQFAIDNSIWSDKWDLVNNGQKRMNTANALRRAIAKGQQIRFNKRTVKFDA
jgi:hypothetical protein